MHWCRKMNLFKIWLKVYSQNRAILWRNIYLTAESGNSIAMTFKWKRFAFQICKYVTHPIAFISLFGCQNAPSACFHSMTKNLISATSKYISIVIKYRKIHWEMLWCAGNRHKNCFISFYVCIIICFVRCLIGRLLRKWAKFPLIFHATSSTLAFTSQIPSEIISCIASNQPNNVQFHCLLRKKQFSVEINWLV